METKKATEQRTVRGWRQTLWMAPVTVLPPIIILWLKYRSHVTPNGAPFANCSLSAVTWITVVIEMALLNKGKRLGWAFGLIHLCPIIASIAVFAHWIKLDEATGKSGWAGCFAALIIGQLWAMLYPAFFGGHSELGAQMQSELAEEDPTKSRKRRNMWIIMPVLFS
ncbi:hypothetical protein HKX48_003799 [Thoreauomyces humboldtii]|nr:hypothetical protein HKX48_003799 [Thoreauomyces humboldtii]